ncbi:hypothetical protein BD410DRAFT_846853 [Rickenella mellea]|uniref:Uncharacterized protein n=1 Tax=Rickenella mellea TaxID=50990 RepID=A0A4Y7PFF0_9AGAM|nr:hypothetical protein BD410DRAFT_846853 [Rickenella mellea]
MSKSTTRSTMGRQGRHKKYKTKEERKDAERRRRREWYDRNRTQESAKALLHYHANRSVRARVSAKHSLDDSQSTPLMEPMRSPDAAKQKRDNPALHRFMLSMCSKARDTLKSWTDSADVSADCAAAHAILINFTEPHPRQWGHYLFSEYILFLTTADPETRANLDEMLDVGRCLQERVDVLCNRSFDEDPSGCEGVWEASRTLRCDVGRAVDIVEELELLGRDGGCKSLLSSFREGTLNFQVY